MRTKIFSFTERLGLCILSVLFALLVVCQSNASGAVAAPKVGPSHESLIKKEMPKILPVLEEKMDRKLVEKSKEKIYGMGDREIRLISALCERIPAEESSVGGDIAFFLVTALIVLS
ncbi:MAG: hypothetical protein ACM3MB_07970 [Acidobacteriota bacterium]